MDWKRGDFVEFDGLLAVVVSARDDLDIPGDHVAVWFGEPRSTRISEGGPGGLSPEVWIIPAEHLAPAKAPAFKH
jgi:hypothetical protein